MEHGRLLESVCETVQMTEPRARITCEIVPQYRNMHYWLCLLYTSRCV